MSSGVFFKGEFAILSERFKGDIPVHSDRVEFKISVLLKGDRFLSDRLSVTSSESWNNLIERDDLPSNLGEDFDRTDTESYSLNILFGLVKSNAVFIFRLGESILSDLNSELGVLGLLILSSFSSVLGVLGHWTDRWDLGVWGSSEVERVILGDDVPEIQIIESESC